MSLPTWTPVGTVRGPSIEVIPYSMQGTLRVLTSVGRFPIVDLSRVISVAAMVEDPPSGDSIVLDVLASGASIFATPADRPTIAVGARRAVVGEMVPNLLLDDDDYLNVDVVQVGSLLPGAFLTVAIRVLHESDTSDLVALPSQ